MAEVNMGGFNGEGEATSMNEDDVIETPQETADFIWESIPKGETWADFLAFRAKVGINPSYKDSSEFPPEVRDLGTVGAKDLSILADMDDISHLLTLMPGLYKAYRVKGEQEFCKVIDHVGQDEADLNPQI